jgi:hypothetical protein
MSIVRNFAEQGFAERIQQFDPDVCAVETAETVMAEWNEAGKTSVFMAGTFDIPTPNHRLGLAEARLMAGSLVCGIDYGTLNEAPEHTLGEVQQAAASGIVKLMVTLDTDEGAASAKAFRPDKGDCPRPIFCWGTRAHNLASYTVPQGNGINYNMVDFVTNHGPNACQACTNCVSRDNALMAAVLQPSLVVVNAASVNTMETILEEKKQGRLPATMIGITNEQDHQFVDKLLGGRVSGTAVVRRARNAAS